MGDHGKVIIVNSPEQFNKEIQKSKVVVDFFATWCPPCRRISPMFIEMSNHEEYAGVTFLKVDVDEIQDVAMQCGIRAMPTFQSYSGGHKVEEFSGADPHRLQAMVRKINTK